MLYLDEFILPDEDAEWKFFISQKSKAYNAFYPFQIFPDKELTRLTFEPVTIFYGNNGSGKSTLLNIIAEKLHLQRGALYNRSSFFEDYLALCEAGLPEEIPAHSQIITSDDIFDAMLNLRALNLNIDEKREEVMQEFMENKFSTFKYRGMDDYEQLKKTLEARRKTQSAYTRDHVLKNNRLFSNGESSLRYFYDKELENGLFLLDEPENSLSPQHQSELVQLIVDGARFFNCQFIIATHSPFLLATPYAKIYDLDTVGVPTRKWTELPGVQTYYQFFETHRQDFN